MTIINSILLTILMMIAAAIVHRLYITKNGKLRKIMLAYFLSEEFLLCGLLFLEFKWGNKILPQTQYIVCIIMLPKVIVKIIFYNYIHAR